MKRENRSITANFETEARYYRLFNDCKAFIDFIVAFIMSIGLQLKHKPGCTGGFSLTRHSHYERVRLNGVPIWRIQCTKCKAVFTVLPHFVLRYRKMSPTTAADALMAVHGGLSLELTAVCFNISAMSVYRLVCSIGRTGTVTMLLRCGLSLPEFFTADEKHSHCLAEKVYLPTISGDHVLWHIGYTEDKSAAAFEASYGQFRDAALTHDPSWKVRGVLTDSFESTVGTMKKLFPGARIGNCLLHAAKKVVQKLNNITTSVRKQLSRQFYRLFQDARERKGLKVFSFGQKLRRFGEKVSQTAGAENGERISEWAGRKKTGWFSVLSCPDMPSTTVRLDQVHNALNRKLFMMKGFHHPDGSQAVFLNGLAALYNFIPYQRRAKSAGRCGVEVEGGKLPSKDWFLSLQILTSGGFGCPVVQLTTKFGGIWIKLLKKAIL